MNLKKNIIRIMIIIILILLSIFFTKYISSDIFNYNFL
jgi:hypothetical protein